MIPEARKTIDAELGREAARRVWQQGLWQPKRGARRHARVALPTPHWRGGGDKGPILAGEEKASDRFGIRVHLPIGSKM